MLASASSRRWRRSYWTASSRCASAIEGARATARWKHSMAQYGRAFSFDLDHAVEALSGDAVESVREVRSGTEGDENGAKGLPGVRAQLVFVFELVLAPRSGLPRERDVRRGELDHRDE